MCFISLWSSCSSQFSFRISHVSIGPILHLVAGKTEKYKRETLNLVVCVFWFQKHDEFISISQILLLGSADWKLFFSDILKILKVKSSTDKSSLGCCCYLFRQISMADFFLSFFLAFSLVSLLIKLYFLSAIFLSCSYMSSFSFFSFLVAFILKYAKEIRF